jgi:hypothetical protein
MAVNINIPSQVSQTITDGVTDKAPSENAVNDALALKANSADLGATAFSNDYNDLDNLPTIPSVTGFVPYTGATQDVDLGTHDLTATQGVFATSGNPDTLTVNHSSGSGKALTITKGGNGEGVYVNKTSGSGNAVTIIGDLEATNIKRTGGTSSQFLKANGSVDSTSYQPTLVSGTNIKTINGNTLLGSGDLVISGGGGAIAVGTTAVTSGTIGRVFFEGTGNVVQQDAAFFFDSTNKAFEIGGGTNSQETVNRVKIGHDNTNQFGYITSLTASFRRLALVPNPNYNGTVTINRPTNLTAPNSAIPLLVESNAASKIVLTSRSNSLGNSLGIEFNFQDGIGANTGNVAQIFPDVESLGGGGIAFNTAPSATGAYTSQMSLKRSGFLGLGTTAPAARLDVRAQGALSTDIAFRVRNSADSSNLFVVKGNGVLNAANLPTSPAGLVTGDIWNNLGILTIV